jgi:tetratricopeptide (TPR) repeat protein
MYKNPAWFFRFALLAFLGLYAAGASAQDTQPAPPPMPPAQPAGQAPAQPPAQGGLTLADLSVPQLMDLADRARVAKKFTDAINLVNFVVQRESGQHNIDVLRMLGEIAYDMKNAEDAQKNWLLVRKVQPGDFGANWGLGRVELDSGQPRNAVSYLEAAERVIPPDKPELAPKLLIKLSQAYSGAGMRTQAVNAAERALKLDQQDLEGWYVLCKLRSEMARTADEFDKALGDADKLIAITDAEMRTKGISPATVQQMQVAYQLKLSVLYAFRELLFEKNPDGKLSDRVVAGQGPLVGRILDGAVDIMLQQAELERLSQYFNIVQMAQEAVNYDGGTNAVTLMKLGNLQVTTGQYDEALKTYQRVLAIDPQHKEAQRQLDSLQARVQPAPPPAP